jgi:CRISPR-associated exonuclease Cas4
MIIDELVNSKINDTLSHKREDKALYVTDLVRCALKIKYEEKYKELFIAESIKPSTILGDLVHEGLEKFLAEKFNAKLEVESEKQVTLAQDVYKIKGRADAIIEGEKKIVIEIKTARADKGLPLEHHKQQLRLYLWLFDANEGILVYITPDRVTEYSIRNKAEDDEVIRLVEETIKLLKTPRYNWECSYCIFNVICPESRKNK